MIFPLPNPNRLFVGLLLLLSLCSCEHDSTYNSEITTPPIPEVLSGPYSIEGSQLLFNDEPLFVRGVNCTQSFGLGNANLMDSWRITIAHEFIGNLESNPFLELPYKPIMAFGCILYSKL